MHNIQLKYTLMTVCDYLHAINEYLLHVWYKKPHFHTHTIFIVTLY